MIRDVYPLKAQFLSGQPIEIAVELYNEEPITKQWLIEIDVCWLLKSVERVTREVMVPAEEELTVTVQLRAQAAEFNGYGVDAVLLDGEVVCSSASTAFDVVSDWRKSTRYGFLSDFYSHESGDSEDVRWLNKLHLNLVQFYDWMYKHDDLVCTQNEYTDLMGRTLNLDVVKEKVELCHQYDMKAIAYGAIYAASKPFYAKHPEWALYQSNGEAYDFIQIFTIMNIEEKSPWRSHIINEYKRTIEKVNFDGIHLDTYGFPKTGISKLEGPDSDQIVRLEEHFPSFINQTRAELEKAKDDIGLIFNNVGNWPVDTVALADQDAIYIEVWKPYERYHHIGQILRWAQHYGQGKPVILAAYLQPFRLDTPVRAQYSALLLTSIIAAHGGYHLLMGENGGVLTQAYYVDHTIAEPDFLRRIRDYYDFNIRYANLLYSETLRDVSMTHVDGDNLEYVFEDVNYSTYGEAGKVWTIVRENADLKTISFINLSNNDDDLWNEGKNKPNVISNMKVKVLLERDVKAVYMMSPDRDLGKPQAVNYEITSSLRGKTLELTIPTLEVWNVLAIEL
ncbi:Cycloisomaltooligosaccharide glucanotransferase precursor [compost metagenome]